MSTETATLQADLDVAIAALFQALDDVLEMPSIPASAEFDTALAAAHRACDGIYANAKTKTIRAARKATAALLAIIAAAKAAT